MILAIFLGTLSNWFPHSYVIRLFNSRDKIRRPKTSRDYPHLSRYFVTRDDFHVNSAEVKINLHSSFIFILIYGKLSLNVSLSIS